MKHFLITGMIKINRSQLLCDSLSTNQKDLEKKPEKIWILLAHSPVLERAHLKVLESVRKCQYENVKLWWLGISFRPTVEVVVVVVGWGLMQSCRSASGFTFVRIDYITWYVCSTRCISQIHILNLIPAADW